LILVIMTDTLWLLLN